THLLLDAPASSCLFFLFPLVMQLRPPTSTLFPYTTLFRSGLRGYSGICQNPSKWVPPASNIRMANVIKGWRMAVGSCFQRKCQRSEEHTSELQSRENLVCRLLLDKKKVHGVHVLRQRMEIG